MPTPRRRRAGGFERAIRDARRWVEEVDGERVYAILLPEEHARMAATRSVHARAVPGGVLFAVEESTLAEMVADTLAALDRGGEQTETFRRRVTILRRLTGREQWAEAERAYELAKETATR